MAGHSSQKHHSSATRRHAQVICDTSPGGAGTGRDAPFSLSTLLLVAHVPIHNCETETDNSLKPPTVGTEAVLPAVPCLQ
jgi:hypothetical protein